MPKVNLPRGSWEEVLYMIEEIATMQFVNKTYAMSLHKEIADQVYAQEY